MTLAPGPAHLPCHRAGRPAAGGGRRPAARTRRIRTQQRPDTETDAAMPVRAGVAYPGPIARRPTSAAIAARPGPGTTPAGSWRLRHRPRRQAIAQSSWLPPPRGTVGRALPLQETRHRTRRRTTAANLTRPRDRPVSWPGRSRRRLDTDGGAPGHRGGGTSAGRPATGRARAANNHRTPARHKPIHSGSCTDPRHRPLLVVLETPTPRRAPRVRAARHVRDAVRRDRADARPVARHGLSVKDPYH